MKEDYRDKKRVGIALRRFITEDCPFRKYSKLFGCENGFLRRFIERQSRGEMTWVNFGKSWVIGHVVPPSEFQLCFNEEARCCWNWINLRPYFRKENSVLSGVEARRVLEGRFLWLNVEWDIRKGLMEKVISMAARDRAYEPSWKHFIT